MASRRSKVSAYGSPERIRHSVNSVHTKKDDEDTGNHDEGNGGGIMSKFQSKLYRAINDRQAAELQQLMEEANRKIKEQHMKLLSEPKRSTSPQLKPNVSTIEPAGNGANEGDENSSGEAKDIPIQIFTKDPPSSRLRKMAMAAKESAQESEKQEQLQQNQSQHNSSQSNYPSQQAQGQFPIQGQGPVGGTMQYYQLQPHHQMQQFVSNSSNVSTSNSTMNTPGRGMIPTQYTASLPPQQQAAAALEPNNRIFLKTKVGPHHEGSKPITLSSVPETIVENHFQRPEVYQSNSSAMNSVNLFANAVSMYANANKVRSMMMNQQQQQQQPSQDSSEFFM